MVTSWALGWSHCWGRTSCPPPVHEAGLVGVTDGAIEPIPFRYVGERKRSFRNGDGHRHLAVGHGEGIGAVNLLCDGHGLAEAVGDCHGPHLVPPVRDGGEGHGGAGLGGGGVCRHGAALGGLHGDSVVGVGGGMSGRTVTVQEALAPLPSAAVAVMTAVPRATAVTTPFSTLATLGLLLVQVTALLVALSGGHRGGEGQGVGGAVVVQIAPRSG